jgi:hypothetical protein
MEMFRQHYALWNQVRRLRFCWIHMNLHRGALGVLISDGGSLLLRKRIRCVSTAVILAADLVRVDNFSTVCRRGATIMPNRARNDRSNHKGMTLLFWTKRGHNVSDFCNRAPPLIGNDQPLVNE